MRPVNVLHRRGPERVVDIVGLRTLRLNDVALSRDPDYRRRQIDEKAKRARWSAIAIVDDHDLAPIRGPPVAAQKPTALVGDGVDARAIRPLEDHYCVGAPSLSTHILGLPAETIGIVVPNDGASTFLDDDPPWLLDKNTIAFAHLMAGAAHIVQTPRIILCWRRHEGALRLRRR